MMYEQRRKLAPAGFLAVIWTKELLSMNPNMIKRHLYNH